MASQAPWLLSLHRQSHLPGRQVVGSLRHGHISNISRCCQDRAPQLFLIPFPFFLWLLGCPSPELPPSSRNVQTQKANAFLQLSS